MIVLTKYIVIISIILTIFNFRNLEDFTGIIVMKNEVNQPTRLLIISDEITVKATVHTCNHPIETVG